MVLSTSVSSFVWSYLDGTFPLPIFIKIKHIQLTTTTKLMRLSHRVYQGNGLFNKTRIEMLRVQWQELNATLAAHLRSLDRAVWCTWIVCPCHWNGFDALFTVYDDDQGVETTFNSLSGFNSFDTASL